MEKHLYRLLFLKKWLDISWENLLQQELLKGHTPADKKAAAAETKPAVGDKK